MLHAQISLRMCLGLLLVLKPTSQSPPENLYELELLHTLFESQFFYNTNK